MGNASIVAHRGVKPDSKYIVGIVAVNVQVLCACALMFKSNGRQFQLGYLSHLNKAVSTSCIIKAINVTYLLNSITMDTIAWNQDSY